MVCVCVFMAGAAEGSTESRFYGEVGNRNCDHKIVYLKGFRAKNILYIRTCE